MLKIFKHSLLRVAGNSFDDLEILNSEQLLVTINQIRSKTEEKNMVKEALSGLLFEAIKNHGDDHFKKKILNLRRDIHNERKIKAALLNEVQSELEEFITQKIDEYSALKHELDELNEAWETAYSGARNMEQVKLQEYCNNEVLLSGLVFSSPDFLEGLSKYRSNRGHFTKDDLNVERTLLKYSTRISSKTSPFSTFTNLGILKTKSDNDAIITQGKAADRRISSHVRFNNYLFSHLKLLITGYKPLYSTFFIRANPTIKIKGEHYTYLINLHNVESFQKIEKNPVLDLILSRLNSEKKGITFDNALHYLAENVEAEVDEIEGYLLQLIRLGFVEYNLGISGIDPLWDIKMLSLLQKHEHKDEVIHEIINALLKIRLLAEQLETVKSDERAGLIQEAFNILKQVFTNAKIIFNFKPQNIFYEDTYNSIDLNIDSNKLHDFIQKVNTLVVHMEPFSYNNLEKKRMELYFRDKYGDRTEVDFLTFYEDYFRDVKLVHDEYEIKLRNKNPEPENTEEPQSEVPKPEPPAYYHTPEIDILNTRLSEWRARLFKVLEKKDHDLEHEFHISQEDLDASLIETGSLGPTSLASFIQFYIRDNQLKGYVNASIPGYGKWMSRFLHILPENVTMEIRRWNEEILGDTGLNIENTDATCFNANLHPTLMPYEMQVPGGNNLLEDDKQLKISDFSVAYYDDKKGIRLINTGTKKEANIFDLGFQNVMGRSKIYQLLTDFSKKYHVSFFPLFDSIHQYSDKIKSGEKTGDRIVSHPRIVYEQDVIIQRKKWYIPKSMIPLKDKDMNEAGFFLKVKSWLNANKIPDEVFLVLNPYRLNKTVKTELIKKLTVDDYKPQYINFNSTLCVSYFEKLLQKMPDFIILEEMLPAADDLQIIDSKKWVTEYLVQWGI